MINFSSVGQWFIQLIGSGNIFYRNSYIIGQRGAVWLDTQKPYILYFEVPQLKMIIDRKATMFSSMRIDLVKESTGEILPMPEALKKLLDMPNCMQSQNEFLFQFKQQEQLYGNQFIYRNKVSLSDYPLALWNSSARYTTPVMTGKLFDQVSIDGIIKEYKIYRMGEWEVKAASEVLFQRLTDLDNPVIGMCPIDVLQMPITNIKLAYEYRNVVMGEKGAIGILSNESKDKMGSIPMKEGEKTQIEKQYQQGYGIQKDKKKVIITTANVKWQPMTYPTKDMLLFEEVEADFQTICDFYGLSINMFSDKNATYENVKQSLIMCYQDTIKPEADKFLQALSKFINLPAGQCLKANYDHLTIMKEDDYNEAQAFELNCKAIAELVSAAIISPEQARTILKNKFDVDVDISAIE